jgi:DNA-binding CsgD family transcriptional regulator
MTTRLTTAERQLITQLVSGKTTCQLLADANCISARTVRTHLCACYRKTGCVNMPGLLLWALRNGWRLEHQAASLSVSARLRQLADELDMKT